MDDIEFLGAFFMVHLVFCCIYFILCKKKVHGRQKTIYCMSVVFFMPVFGLLYLTIWDGDKSVVQGDNTERLFFGNSEREVEHFYLRSIDKESEADIVSLEEALSINSYQVRRKMIMNTLQDEDTTIYIEALKKALKNEDIETSHYATAVIMEMQRKINDILVSMEKAFNSDNTDRECMIKLEDCLFKIIFAGIYDEHNLLKYIEKYRHLSDEILAKDEEEKFYFHRIKLDLKIQDYTHAGVLCKGYAEKFPESEDMVICNLKYCVLILDKKRMDDFLNELKNFPVKLTQESLKYIRFFNE